MDEWGEGGQARVKFVRYDGADDGLIALLTTGRARMDQRLPLVFP